MASREERRDAATKGLKRLREEYRDTVYEVKRIKLKNGDFVTERRVTTEGYSERVVWESKWQEKERWDCYCCTCDYDDGYPGNDAACRNHGHYGKRPCENHNTPGYTWEDTNEMPDSVQVYRAKQEAALATTEGKN